MPFVKLDCGILDSSLWVEDPEIRITFITMLAMCDPTGLCAATAPGIARRANLPLDVVRNALDRLESPDPDSRTPESEGRRIQRCEDGYRVLNFLKYREKDHTAAARMRRHRERLAAAGDTASVTRNDRNAVASVTPSSASASHLPSDSALKDEGRERGTCVHGGSDGQACGQPTEHLKSLCPAHEVSEGAVTLCEERGCDLPAEAAVGGRYVCVQHGPDGPDAEHEPSAS